MGNGDSQDENIELEGDGALKNMKIAFIIVYLQVGEVLDGLTTKEHDQVLHRAKRTIPYYECGWMDEGNCVPPITT
jgi:hypothetical protein